MKISPSTSNPGRLSVPITKTTLPKLTQHFTDMKGSRVIDDLISQGGGVESLGYKAYYADGPNGMEDNTWWVSVWWESNRHGIDIRAEQVLATERDSTGQTVYSKPLRWELVLTVGKSGSFGLDRNSFKVTRKLNRPLPKRASAIKTHAIATLQKFLG